MPEFLKEARLAGNTSLDTYFKDSTSLPGTLPAKTIGILIVTLDAHQDDLKALVLDF